MKPKTLVLTGCDGEMAKVGDLTAAGHRRYARRWGYAFERVTEYEKGTHPSWQKLRLLMERLPRYDAILWLDADAVITNPWVPVSDRIAGPGLTVSTDWTWPAAEDAVKHFSMGNFVLTRCTGSEWLLQEALKRTQWANEPLWEQQALQEVYRANEGLANLTARDLIHILPRRELNAVPAYPNTTGPEPWQPGDFLAHLTYQPNHFRAQEVPRWDAEGFWQVVRGKPAPAHYETGMAMDVRHIALVRELLARGGFASALEIGVWKGAASCAFIDALEALDIREYHACDVGFSDEWYETVKHEGQMTPWHMRSTELLALIEAFNLPPEFILVDGDHSAETGREEGRLLLARDRKPRMIVGHDSRSAQWFGNCEGPAITMEMLREAGYAIREDAEDRPGEMTKRGLYVAYRPEDEKTVEGAFAVCI